ncbi:MAG: hypothetical protein SFW35_12090 [Chitinophagales bacterium]|nr:hypothetical protein [Chitinophagales bacterium]
MIIYGWKSSTLLIENPAELTCTNCNTQGSINIAVLGKYAHIFWIPLFPIGRTGASVCAHCKQNLDMGSMPFEYKEAYERIKPSAKRPARHYFGLGLFVLIIGAGLYLDKTNKTENKKFLNAPMAGDVYEVENQKGNYTKMKLLAVGKDTVEIVFHQYYVNKISGLHKLDDMDFDTTVYLIPRSSLLEMDKKGDIVDIERDK